MNHKQHNQKLHTCSIVVKDGFQKMQARKTESQKGAIQTLDSQRSTRGREAQLIRQRDYMYRWTNERQQQLHYTDLPCGTSIICVTLKGIQRKSTATCRSTNSPITRSHNHTIPIDDVHPSDDLQSTEQVFSVINSLECENILLLQSAGQHALPIYSASRQMLCQACPRCLNICLVGNIP